MEKIILQHTSWKAEDLKRDPTRFEGSYFEHWADYLNEMAYLEASEGTQEWSDVLELRDTKGPLSMNDDLLFALFDEPIEQIVPVGWEPTFKEAIKAVMSLLKFQLQLYMNVCDPGRADRKLLKQIGNLMAKDRHLFKSPDGLDAGQFPLDFQP